MTKKDNIEVTGTVTEVLADSKYRIKLESGHIILGYMSGRMKKNKIQVIISDSVLVELTPYDLTRGRITRRLTPGFTQSKFTNRR
ncbi:MAG: translation initiation factor IF-1 [bacterium]|nr:translation initiation factor IF-1 [bacterium]